MAVAVESDPEGEPGLIENLLAQIYENYQPEDVMPDGVEVRSSWGDLRITAIELGDRAIEAYFDEMELTGFSTSPLINPLGVLTAIRKCQQDVDRPLSALD